MRPPTPVPPAAPLLIALALGAVIAPCAAAQGAPPLPPPALAAVRGVVVDSLLAAPLAGARIWIGDGTHWTTSDSAGRFLLDSIDVGGGAEGAAVFAEHPAADSVGLPTLYGVATLRAGDTTSVVVAIPSYATLRAAACHGIADAGDAEGGIVFGTVRAAGTGAPLPGASVDVGWSTLRATDASRIPVPTLGALTASAGDDGVYYVCGVPTAFRVLVRAHAPGIAPDDSLRSDEIGVLVGARRIQRRDLTVGAEGGATVVVSIAAADGRPVAGGRAYVGDGEPVAIADGATAVTMRGVRAGTRVVGARAIGFTPAERVVEVAPGDTVRVALTLSAQPQQLATVRVGGRLAAAEARHAAYGGYLMRGEALAKAPTIGFVVPVVPSRVRDASRAGTLRFTVLGRDGTWCSPKVMLDGFRSDLAEVSMYRPDELLAVELYPEARSAPPQYLRPDEYDCGLLLVWTRKGAGG